MLAILRESELGERTSLKLWGHGSFSTEIPASDTSGNPPLSSGLELEKTHWYPGNAVE